MHMRRNVKICIFSIIIKCKIILIQCKRILIIGKSTISIYKSILIKCKGMHMTSNSTFLKIKYHLNNNCLNKIILITISFLTNYEV